MPKRRRGNGEGTVYRRSDGYWGASVVVGYRSDGRPVRRSRCARTQREALERLAALRAQSLAAPNASDRERLADYLEQWLENSVRASVSPSTHRSYSGYVRNHITPVLGGVRLARLAPTHVQALQAELSRRGASPTVRLHVHVVLRRALAQALRFGLIARNPCDVVPRPRLPRRQPTWLDAAQVRVLLDAARGDRLEALAILAVTTGLREGELLGLQWGDLDLAAGTLAVSRQLLEHPDGTLATGELKTARSRRLVELPAVAVDALRRQRAGLEALPHPTAPVFTGSEGGLVRRSNLLRRWFYPLLERARLPRIRFHDLRHTHASLLLAQGVNPKIVQERLGHSQISVTLDTYSHVLPTLQRDAARRIDELLGP